MPTLSDRCLRGLALACLLLTTAFLPPRQEPPSINITQVDASGFPRITVYISVTDAAGEPVALDPSRIVLSENGERVTADGVRSLGEGETLATLLVVDVSGSMNKAGKLEAAKVAATAYVRQMKANDVAGLLTFNTASELVQPLTGDRLSLLTAIERVAAADDTAMYDALYEAVGLLSGREGRNSIILLTDGMDNRSRHSSAEVISLIGPSGLSISTVGLGDPAQMGLSQAGLDVPGLRSLAERAGGTYAYAADQASLKAIYERYSRALHSEYAISYTTKVALRDGVNRSLSATLTGERDASSVIASYNPGGLVPEVAQANTWPLFFGLMAFLLVLLAAPSLIGRAMHIRRGRPAARIKLEKSRTSRVRLR